MLRFSDPAGGRYAGLALRDDRVVAGAVIGLPDAAASLVQFYDSRRPAPTDRLGFLLGRALPGAGAADPDALPDSAVICRCNTVTKAALSTAFDDGAHDAADLSRATRAGTGCGTCRDTLCQRWTDRATPAVGLGILVTPANRGRGCCRPRSESGGLS